MLIVGIVVVVGAVRKAVIAAAGLGTRLLPISKELPKEMLPLFTVDSLGRVVIKPLLQIVFEQFYQVGVREFCFIVGRGKRAIEDHFTPDWRFIEELYRRGGFTGDLENFYRMVEDSTIVWVNQPKPLGFGHAVYLAKSFVGGESFLVAAGDTCVISSGMDHIYRLLNTFTSTSSTSSLLLKEVKNPGIYGVVEAQSTSGMLRITYIVEKPKSPPSNLAVMPFYAFKPTVMDALTETRPGVGGEIQLTDAIQKLIEWGELVTGVVLRGDEVWLDIGTPENYWQALEKSYRYWSSRF